MCSMVSKLCLALELLLLLHCLLETGIQGHSEHTVFELSGRNVSLPISNLPDDYKELTLLYTSNQAILKWKPSQPNPFYYNTQFKDRIRLDLQNGMLYIYKVQKEDSSTYLLKMSLLSGTEEGWRIPLEVFDPVPKPAIIIKKAQEVNNSCYLSLSCEIPEKSVNYTWYSDSGPFPKELQSDVLEITVKSQNYSKFYVCQVSNPVSNENDTVYFTSACTPAQSSGVAWIAARLVVMVPTILGLLLTWDQLS